MTTDDTTSVTLSPIGALLTDPERLAALDISKIEALYALSERDEMRRAKAAFYSDFAQMQGELEPVKRSAKNSHTNSQYALLDHIEGMLRPILNRWGFSYSGSQRPNETEGWTTYTLRLRHRHGHHEDYEMPLPWDQAGAGGKTNKTLIHALGSSQTYGTRYLLVNSLGVQTTLDDDGVGASRMAPGSRSVSPAAAAEIQRLMDESGASLGAFLAYFKIEAISELPVDRYEEACRRLTEKARLNDQLKDIADQAGKAGITDELVAALSVPSISKITPGQIPRALSELDRLITESVDSKDLDSKVGAAMDMFKEG